MKIFLQACLVHPVIHRVAKSIWPQGKNTCRQKMYAGECSLTEGHDGEHCFYVGDVLIAISLNSDPMEAIPLDVFVDLVTEKLKTGECPCLPSPKLLLTTPQ